mgnify:CR=1 FL=1
MAVGANSVRPPLFAYMVCTNSTPPQLLETGRRISAKQKLRCSPTGIRASFCAAKSLRSLRIYVLLWDRIAVQIVLLRYFFCLISYFYMLLILQSAPSRLSPNEALPHTPLRALPLDPTSPPAPGLSVRFISRFARCFILLYACNLLWSAMLIPHSSFLIPHSSFNSAPHLTSPLIYSNVIVLYLLH